MTTCKEVFKKDGVLSEVLENYSPRQEQLALATKIEDVLEANQVLIGEAGTGVGKSLAYLIPVLLSGKHTIISTGTKHLQDQLFFKDVPMVKKALALV
jgi:ATP-dependent DNA helicase DinG